MYVCMYVCTYVCIYVYEQNNNIYIYIYIEREICDGITHILQYYLFKTLRTIIGIFLPHFFKVYSCLINPQDIYIISLLFKLKHDFTFLLVSETHYLIMPHKPSGESSVFGDQVTVLHIFFNITYSYCISYLYIIYTKLVYVMI